MSDEMQIGPNQISLGRARHRELNALCLLLLLGLYAAGLTRGLSRPWTGLHDWNGAFYSQLARNLLRYPMAVHHGMGVVAVGEAVPPPEERSIYATHPPGLIWLVALAFRVFGETEWAARLVPVLAALGSLVLLQRLVRLGWGHEASLLAGLLYAVMPMAVYFGRMVNHEAVCLLCILAAMAAWPELLATGSSASRRKMAGAIWAVAIGAAIWIDWPGALFAALFCVYVLFEWRRGRISGRLLLFILSISALACLGMLAHLVYGGLEGRWNDLIAVFFSRATESELQRMPYAGKPWEYTLQNLTWPMLVLAGAGLGLKLRRKPRAFSAAAPCSREAKAESVRGLFPLLSVTGVVWIAVFWQQYERHQYWLFYLGPTVVLLAAQTLLAIRGPFAARASRRARLAMYVVVAGTMALAFRGTDAYFAMICFPHEEASALQQINRSTQPDDRVLLAVDIVHVKRFGGYVYRGVIPYYAYYLDRAFDWEQNPAAVAQKASRYAVYILPIAMANEQPSHVVALRRQFADAVIAGPYFVFRLGSGPQ